MMTAFSVHSPNTYLGPFPKFSKPQLVGCYSSDSGGGHYPDLRHMRYLHKKYRHKSEQQQVSLDLDKGYYNAIKKDPNHDAKLDQLLKWISLQQKRITADFVCWRGLLKIIQCTPYEQQEGWQICATKYKGRIYLHANITEAKRQRISRTTEREMHMQSWGYKFEQYLMTDAPDKCPDTNGPVNECEEFCCVFQSKLNNHYLLYGAEIDGVDSEQDITIDDLQSSKVCLVELKTSRVIQNDRHRRTFSKFKLLQWWTQSFLVGIEKIHCGFRDDDGFVSSLEEFPMKTIKTMGKEYWEPTVCMNFLDQFLTYVKNIVQEEKGIYLFDWSPRTNVTASYKRQDNCNCIPNWFKESLAE